jgi:hypothetical protein
MCRDHEVVGSTFLLKIGKFPPDYTESDPRSFVVTAVITSRLKLVASPGVERERESLDPDVGRACEKTR